LHIRRRDTGGAHGEGTFDFIGVGSALQSRHYKRMVEDDLVGRKAVESPTVMDKTIDYHRLLVGAFESDDALHENDELVVGNRWGYSDLNSWIEENEPWFRFEAHSALGGCCDLHPSDIPIFPEEFNAEKLAKFKRRLGPYLFSCQFLNNPVAPEDADFQLKWLRYYKLVKNKLNRDSIEHEVQDGVVMRDVPVSFLSVAMAVDPNHSGNAAGGRARHAIVVIGLSDSGDYYLLEYWAKHASYDALLDNVYRVAAAWNLRSIGLETIAAQKYLGYHIEKMNRYKPNPLKIIELKGEVDAPDGSPSRKKEWRIRSMEPIFSRGNFWVQSTMQDFLTEYQTFPKCKTFDILDAAAYIPQMLRKHVPFEKHAAMMAANRARAQEVGRPYAVAVQ
jgi:phage terminase large subunit-like protein